MAISIYRWTDGPYLAFNDQDSRRDSKRNARTPEPGAESTMAVRHLLVQLACVW